MKKIITIYATPEFAKAIVISSMSGKEVDVFGVLQPKLLQADGQKIISDTYSELDSRVSVEDFTEKKEFFIRKNKDIQYQGIILKPSLNVAEEICRQLKLNFSCISFTLWID